MHDKQDETGEQRVVALVEEFLTARSARKPSPHTLEAYRRDLLSIVRLVAEDPDAPLPLATLPISALTARTLRVAFARFAATRAVASIYRAWSTWNTFFAFLVADGVVAGNPMPAVGKPSAPPALPKPLRGEETPERLLEAVARDDDRRQRYPWPERDMAVIALALCAGLRLSELLALRVGSLAGRPGERRVEVAGKGGRARVVPVEPELDAVVTAYLESRVRRFGARSVGRTSVLLVDRHGEPLRRGGLQYLVESCYRRAGITDRVPAGAQLHALRHTFATRLAEDGANAAEIMRLLGHASLTTSQNYIDVTAGQQRAAVRANRTNQSLGRLLASVVPPGS
ncbi:tyrosine-type recombinase/integrase [Polymorphospora rubra]|uniref:tyrosine-type recombinase/integrase n=1 Tax=Polymorphospora rubra TaxID=338584 RepID=UPI0033F83076